MKFSASGAIDVALSRREFYPIYGNPKIKDDGTIRAGKKGYRRTMNGSKTNTEFLYPQHFR